MELTYLKNKNSFTNKVENYQLMLLAIKRASNEYQQVIRVFASVSRHLLHHINFFPENNKF